MDQGSSELPYVGLNPTGRAKYRLTNNQEFAII